MSYETVVQALAGWFKKPLNKIPRERRTFAEAYIKNWASLSPADREKRAIEVDRQRATKLRIKFDRARRKAHEAKKDPKRIAEETFGWWEASLDATAWWKQDNVTYKEAAMLLCCHDPRETCENEVERSTMLDDTAENGQTWNVTPKDYKRLRDAFNAQVHTSQDRTLAYWLALAQKERLSYHGWIDQWLKAREIATTREAEATTQSKENANCNDPPSTPAESKKQGAKAINPTQRQPWQEEKILKRIRELKYAPKNLPARKPGKPGIKAELRTHFGWQGTVFDKAWERLRSQGEIGGG